jgi:hypothetical protein
MIHHRLAPFALVVAGIAVVYAALAAFTAIAMIINQ